ncbi:Coenzyme F420-reducing hydrogenase, beta subunit [Geoglobus ahangari]|uniref:Coenzyme F420-reducing hydrogenase, beta subunit n=1 Tax=Geoglobus ahangari TaxID=113653 RepID=A0A0F7IHA1_9EURY|nr:Coenzyme F420-reducing hydrogenase, beta subunit [Geoglobus ahangari]NOY11120.1 F420H(2):quinone oxidoreductase [Archaeoglobi archaeon]
MTIPKGWVSIDFKELEDLPCLRYAEKPDRSSSYRLLKEKVVDAGICSHCGTCTICPVDLIILEDRPVDFDPKKGCMGCGVCVAVCPRYNYQPISGLGEYIEAVAGKSKRFVGQDGAMVSEFMATALEMGEIEVALFVARDEMFRPYVVHVRTPDELLDQRITGTKYSYANVMPELHRIIRRVDSVGIIGTPCMISGLRKLQEKVPLYKKKVKLAVGLFCTENFYWHELYDFLKERGADLKNAVKTDIKKGNFIVTFKDGSEFTISVKEMEEIVPSGCHVCQDFSAIEADVSVGSVGSKAGFSTVLIRSETAKKIYDYMLEKGYIETAEAKLNIVQKLCDFKVKIHPYNPKTEECEAEEGKAEEEKKE